MDNEKLFECTRCALYETMYLTHLVIEKDGKKGLVDYDGNLISSPKYDQFETEKFGFIVYSKDRSKGLIDLKGTDLLDSRRYEFVEPLSEEEARVFNGNKWEHIKIVDK